MDNYSRANGWLLSPDKDELSEFASMASTAFMDEVSGNDSINVVPEVMRGILHLSPITGMEDAFAGITVLETEHRILSASDLCSGLVPRHVNSVTLNLDPLVELVCPVTKRDNAANRRVVPEYGTLVPGHLRGAFVLGALVGGADSLDDVAVFQEVPVGENPKRGSARESM